MFNWKIAEKIKLRENNFSNLHPVIASILYKRGVTSQESIEKFLFPEYNKDILDPFLFSQMDKVVSRISDALRLKEKVMIFGDYDADGVTSSIILKEALQSIGINPEVYIPDKKLEGYGLNDKTIESFASKGGKLIITVDCGIANFGEIDKANDLGLDVIITDHHHIPENIPNAYAIINPKMENSGYPFRELAGVGVAFKVAQAIYEKILPEEKEQVKWLLDLVAIGTVADMVPLVEENRAIVKYGLIVLSKTRRVGLQELFRVGNIVIDENNLPDTEKISFQLAPRINAAGRMDHANIAFYLLQENDKVKARSFALDLEGKNQQRQKMTKVVSEEIKKVAQNSFKNKKFIFSVGPNFPVGIIGLVAGRISNEFNKPTAVLTKEKDISVGSFRSIPQVNIIEAISKCSELLMKFGGHSQAAGISIKNENLEAFYAKMDRIIEDKLKGKDLNPEIHIDCEIGIEDISFDLIGDIEKMQPFGEGNREPIFLIRGLIIQDFKWVGNGEKHLKLFLRSAGNSAKIVEAIGFNLAERFKESVLDGSVDVVFSLQQDQWNGSKKIQMKIIDMNVLSD